jgi:predicted transcriptional regulator
MRVGTQLRMRREGPHQCCSRLAAAARSRQQDLGRASAGRRGLTALRSDGIYDGMPSMTHRTTFALDKATAKRLRRLAALWRVSQAEVVRRAIAQAEAAASPTKPDPVTLLEELHAAGQGLDAARAEAYLEQTREDRQHWRGE